MEKSGHVLFWFSASTLGINIIVLSASSLGDLSDSALLTQEHLANEYPHFAESPFFLKLKNLLICLRLIICIQFKEDLSEHHRVK